MSVPDLDLDQVVLCPECRRPLRLDLPCIVVPGECVQQIDADSINWDEHRNDKNWTCSHCCQFEGFPEDYDQEAMIALQYM